MKKDIVIIFHGKAGTQFIDEEQEKALYDPEVARRGSLVIDGCYISLSSIARVIPADKYYAENPEKRPAEKIPLFRGLPEGGTRERYSLSGASDDLIRGLEKHIASAQYKGTDKPHDLIATLRKRKEAASKADGCSDIPQSLPGTQSVPAAEVIRHGLW